MTAAARSNVQAVEQLLTEAVEDYKLAVKHLGRLHVISWLNGYFQVAAKQDPSLLPFRTQFVSAGSEALGEVR